MYKPRYFKCVHCGVEFLEKDKGRIWNFKKNPAYCSAICRKAAKPKKEKKYSFREYGPCPICNQMFQSRTPKKYCSMKCYTSDPVSLERLRKLAPIGNAAAHAKHKRHPAPENRNCINCGKEYLPARGNVNSKYCSHSCYRLYMDKRFDRWIASPQAISLPQNYDEFLTLGELPCLVDGCTWKGHHLSLHMNQAHGVQAGDFKRAAGFNLGSGIISLPLHEQLCERPHIQGGNPSFAEQGGVYYPPKKNYSSLEGREHGKKAHALMAGIKFGEKKCRRCGVLIEIYGGDFSKEFCSVECRTKYYKDTDKERIHTLMPCVICGKDFWISSDQFRRLKKGLPTGTCSLSCRQKLNSPRGQGSHSEWKTVKKTKGMGD